MTKQHGTNPRIMSQVRQRHAAYQRAERIEDRRNRRSTIAGMNVRMVKSDVDLRRSGALWAVNEYVLWPLGLALTLEVDDNGEQQRAYLSEWTYPPGEGETIADGLYAEADLAMEPEHTEPAVRFARLMGQRIANLKPGEQELAVERLRPILDDMQGSEEP